jgi:hypothetical protein
MPDVIDCPTCGRKLRRPDGLAGQLVRCPKCSATFAATPAEEEPPLAEAVFEPPPLPPPADGELRLSLDDDRPHRARGVPPPPRPLQAVPVPPTPAAAADRGCPYCGEPLRGFLRRCPACGRCLHDGGPTPLLRRDLEPHRAALILTLGILSLALLPTCLFTLLSPLLGLTAWIMAQHDLRKMDANVMDPAGRNHTRFGRACGIAGTMVGLLFVLWCGLRRMA